MTPDGDTGILPALQPQTATSTVDRRWVHRAAVAEVFLTDLTPTDETSFTADCQLPRRHSYYGDHVPGVLDPMLLLESCRQAETCGAHAVLDVPLDAKFVLKEWTLDCPPVRHDGSAPAHLGINVTVDVRRPASGDSITCTYAMALTVDAAAAGSVSMKVTYLDAERYGRLRTMRRTGRPPMSDDVPAAIDGIEPIRPVGRRDPRNVLLQGIRKVKDGSFDARLLPPVAHPSLFDHPLDHVPGMAVTEAATQLAVAATGRPGVVGLSAVFHRFLELDAETVLTADPGTDPDHDGVTVRTIQDGVTAAEVVVRCVAPQSQEVAP